MGRVGQDGDETMILGRTSNHARAADVDLFDRFIKSNVRFSDGLFERVEVDTDQIDGLDIVLGHGADMLWIVAKCKQAAVDFWVEGFDPAIHHFRERGDLLDGSDLQPGVCEQARGATGGDQLDIKFCQALGEIDQLGFVTDRK